MKAMETCRRRGMVKVLGKNYQNSCLPYPTDVIDSICSRLPVIANDRNEDLIKVIKVRVLMIFELVLMILLHTKTCLTEIG